MIPLALKLILAHIMGDFLFQPTSWVKKKEKDGPKSRYLYFHIAVHLVFLLLLLQGGRQFMIGIIIITASHFLIDLGKIWLNARLPAGTSFWLDQLAHVIIISLVVWMYYPYTIDVNYLLSMSVLATVISVLLLISVVPVLMRIILTRWERAEEETGSLHQAGYVIGIIERLLVFVFIVFNLWQAIGFLIAAKSVFRFGDLKEGEDRKRTEYILIGTLTSFSFAIAVGLAYRSLLNLGS